MSSLINVFYQCRVNSVKMCRHAAVVLYKTKFYYQKKLLFMNISLEKLLFKLPVYFFLSIYIELIMTSKFYLILTEFVTNKLFCYLAD